MQRDSSIDFFKALTVINILFIHTVWWSGSEYVPKWLAQLSLLIDVPFFFFLSGCSATFSFQKTKPFSGIIRLILLFTIFYFLYGLLLHTNYTFDYFFSSLTANYLGVSELAVFGPSLWFIPVFIVVYLVSYFLVKHVGEKNNLLVVLLLLLIASFFSSELNIFERTKILSVDSLTVISYLVFFLTGYLFYKHKSDQKIRYFIGFIATAMCFNATWFLLNEGLQLQENKFPIKFPYTAISFFSIAMFVAVSQQFKFNYKLNYFGKNALVFYLVQGVTSSWLFIISPYITCNWVLKVLLMFGINLLMASVISVPVIYVFNKYLSYTKAWLTKWDRL